MISEDEQFAIISKYFSSKGPALHQFDSYEYLVGTLFQKIINETPSIIIDTKNTKYKLKFGKVYVEKASCIDEKNQIKYIYPNEARMRNLTYEANVSVDVSEEFWELLFKDDEKDDEKRDKKEFEKVNEVHNKKVMLFKIPVMLGSSVCNLNGLTVEERVEKGECWNDPGGYFIVNGKERSIVYQERINYNQVFVFESIDEKYSHSAEIRSMCAETGHSVLLQAKIDKNKKGVCFLLPYTNKEVKAGAVFKALGFMSKDIFHFISPVTKEEIAIVDGLIRESMCYKNKIQALEYISKSSQRVVEDDDDAKKLIYTQQVIENELFPHLGISTNTEKAILLGSMCKKLFRVVCGLRPVDDRDNVSLKRIEGPCLLFGDLFRMSLKRFCNNLIKYLEKRQDAVNGIARTNSAITMSIKSCMSTGNWSMQKNSYVRTGVCQIMSRLSYPATISHLRRIVIPVGKEAKNVKIRQLHPSQLFFVDGIETPEGKSVGIVKNLALSANITTGYNETLVKETVEKCKYIQRPETYLTIAQEFYKPILISTHNRDDVFIVYVNGSVVGITQDPDDLYLELEEFKKYRLFNEQVSFVLDEEDKEIRVLCDSGRYIRPLLVVKNNKLLITPEDIKTLTWDQMLDKGFIRYLDSAEVEYCTIAMNVSDLESNTVYNYCEIHPSLMLGVCSGAIPYPEHIQNPRLIYQSSMVKQALGHYATNFQQRFETVVHVMHYPQKPLANTRYDKFLHYDEMLTGFNPIVAIAAYGGQNQEDSIIINKNSIDRGMEIHTCYKTIQGEENSKTNSSVEKIEIPPKKVQQNNTDYSKLGPNGVVEKGARVFKGDIVIGKTVTKISDEEKTDCSVTIANGEEGVVDDIWEGINEEGQKMVKIRIRQLRIPEVGDKNASRSSQKGVLGLLLNQEDMPFTSQGIVPDLIINPLSQPSRMTISQLIECLGSKVSCMTGNFSDATAFSKGSINPMEGMAEQLKAYGFSKYGHERLSSGFTGEMLDADIFIGPTYYQRLKHLVKDKLHSRAKGEVTMLYNQPLEGRSRDGGLRVGEMERDCLISHGISSSLTESFRTLSDDYQVDLCEGCGTILSTLKNCRVCNGKISTVSLPYCCKLLLQELQAMNVKISINVVAPMDK